MLATPSKEVLETLEFRVPEATALCCSRGAG